ncbi:MAG: hypothetical protein Q9195_004080 [Heterodermia aff. obscurata]
MESLTTLAGLKSLQEAHHFLDELQAGLNSIVIQGENIDELWFMHDWYSYILELWMRQARKCYGIFEENWIPILNNLLQIIEATVEFVVNYSCASDRPPRSSAQEKPDNLMVRTALSWSFIVHFKEDDDLVASIKKRPDRNNWKTSLLDSRKPFRQVVADVRNAVKRKCSREELEAQRRCGIGPIEFLEYIEELEEKVQELISFLPTEMRKDLYVATSNFLYCALLILDVENNIGYLQLIKTLSSKWFPKDSAQLPHFNTKYQELVQKLFGSIITGKFIGWHGKSAYTKKDFADIIALGADVRGEVHGQKDCCLWAAALSGCPLDIFEALVQAGAPYTKSVDWLYNCSLQAAGKAGRSDIIGFLLNNHLHSLTIDVNDYYPNALHTAAELCSKKAISLLLQHPGIKADTMPKDYTPFLLAVKADVDCRDKSVVVRNFIDSKLVDPFRLSRNGENALHLAADLRDTTLLIMLEYVNHVNAQDYKGETPLHRAVRANYQANVELLLKHGADATIADVDGYTPLQLACEERCLGPMEALLNLPDSLVNQWPDGIIREPWPCVRQPWILLHPIPMILYRLGFDTGEKIQNARRALKLVLAAGTDIEASDKLGKSILSQMIYIECEDVILDLLHAGADVNSQDKKGNTPLHNLLRLAFIKCKRFELLLKWGANPDIKNNEGQTPISARFGFGPHYVEEGAEDLRAIVRRHKAGIAEAQGKGKGRTTEAKPQRLRHQDGEKLTLRSMSNRFSILMDDEES